MTSSLVIREPGFYCQRDEKSFFDWLMAIPGIKGAKGASMGLIIDISTSEMDRVAWSDLIGLFARYKVDMKCINQIEMGTHEKWLKESNHYWHKMIF